MEKNKKTIWQALICIGLLCVIWGSAMIMLNGMHQSLEGVIEDDFSWVAQVDEVKVENGMFILKGFAFELNLDAHNEAFEIVLHSLDTDKYYFPKMRYEERTDVNDYFLCEYDYTMSGFVATIREKKLNLSKGDYEILLRPSGSHMPYRIGTYLSNGELVYTNPKEYVPLDVVGTDLEEIVEDGVLRVYNLENHMYVYQYEGELYWIAETQYAFDENGDVGVPYQLSTTQIENLPENRLQNHWDWDNRGFLFGENEVIDWSTEKYRVTKKKLPVEYSIVKIWTGKHDGEWIWLQHFRPWYELSEENMNID